MYIYRCVQSHRRSSKVTIRKFLIIMTKITKNDLDFDDANSLPLYSIVVRKSKDSFIKLIQFRLLYISHNLTEFSFLLCGALIMMNQYRAAPSNNITSGSLFIVVGVYSAGYPSQKPSVLAVCEISDNLLQDFQSIENTTEPHVNPRQT